MSAEPVPVGPSRGLRERLLRSQGSLVGATAALTLSRVLGAALGYVGTAVVVRQLSEGRWGLYAYVFSLLGLVGVVADLQLSRSVYRALDEDADAGSVAGSYLLLRGAIGTTSYVVALALLLGSPDRSQVLAVGVVGGLALVGGNLSGAVGSIFTLHRWFFALATAAVLGQAVAFLALLLVVARPGAPSLVALAATAVLKDLVTLVLLLWLVRARVALRLRVRPAVWRSWLSEALPLSIGGALTVAYTRVDSLLLGRLDSLEAVGRYGIGYRFADLLGFLAVTVGGVVLAPLVRAWPDRLADFHRTFRHAFVVSLALAAVGAVEFGLFAPELIRLTFGARYTDVAGSARLLVGSEALHFLTVLCFITLTAVRRTRAYPFVVLAGLGLNVCINLVVIPHFSYQGAAVVTLGTEVAVTAALLALVSRVEGVRPLPVRSSVVVVAAVLVAGAAGLGVASVAPWPAAAVVVAVVAALVMHLLRVEGPGGLPGLVRAARLEPGA
ncbi:MAG: hypothetical protein JWM64_306 [Frankiales bacterium]|nr:hypothetical protein [Frankiales bacterium]